MSFSAEENSELDPRIKIELENLNSATDDINKLEIELEEANSTFRILLNESTRRLKLSSKKLGNCIDKARPYYEALEKAKIAQIECQKAAVKFQRANEIHAAAKETVALAEQRFMSNSHEWQFDNAWQEMLNHATQKVMDAEKQKAECHAEHEKHTRIFHVTEQKVQQLEERFRRSILKSRPYFEEKQICQDQLQTQKNRIEELQVQIQTAKNKYATALRNLEHISDDIHRQRGDYPQLLGTPPPGPREPGVGAELNSPVNAQMPPLPDFHIELGKCDYPSISDSQVSLGAQSQKSESLPGCSEKARHCDQISLATAASIDDSDLENDDVIIKSHNTNKSGRESTEQNVVADFADDNDLETLRQKVKFLAVRPIEGGDGQRHDIMGTWEHELNATVDKLDHLLLLKECAKLQEIQKPFENIMTNKTVRPDSVGAEILHPQNPLQKISELDLNSLPNTPDHVAKPLKKLHKLEPLPMGNVSMRELPLLSPLSNEVLHQSINSTKQRRRRSLE
ncbi:SH3 domain-binding protein 5 homolog isoform X2 [Stomoxys calcitrans]|uniref:SH3 domain-binding protein 5 homolog n=1 Tax=Stomoxys calcitrans TaxID=35570 RepID=A0A1I8NMY1_STOCA|nr:SH3 domain-binding protein 5 homolog isoform X2 [Stomoxys calcitrans]